MASGPDLFAGVLPFFHVAEERSYRRAAQRLGVSPAAVSKAVLRLEEGLGVKLLARTSRTVALTQEGAVFLERCRDAISSLQAGREQLSESRRHPRGELVVTLPFILGRLVIPELAKIAARYPGLSFRMSLTDRLVRLVEEGVDVAVRVGSKEDSSLIARKLRGSRWVTVAAPSWVARHGPPAHPDDLAGHDCLRFVAPNGRPRDWTFADPATGRTLPTRVTGRLLVDHGEHLLEAAAAGLGICQVLDLMVGESLRSGRLVEVLGSWAAPGPDIHALATPERSRSPNVRAFFAFLTDLFHRMEAPGARPK